MEGDPGVAEMVVVEESEALVPVSRQQVQGDLRAEAVASAQLPPEASPPPEQLLELDPLSFDRQMDPPAQEAAPLQAMAVGEGVQEAPLPPAPVFPEAPAQIQCTWCPVVMTLELLNEHMAVNHQPELVREAATAVFIEKVKAWDGISEEDLDDALAQFKAEVGLGAAGRKRQSTPPPPPGRRRSRSSSSESRRPRRKKTPPPRSSRRKSCTRQLSSSSSSSSGSSSSSSSSAPDNGPDPKPDNEGGAGAADSKSASQMDAVEAALVTGENKPQVTRPSPRICNANTPVRCASNAEHRAVHSLESEGSPPTTERPESPTYADAVRTRSRRQVSPTSGVVSLPVRTKLGPTFRCAVCQASTRSLLRHRIHQAECVSGLDRDLTPEELSTILSSIRFNEIDNGSTYPYNYDNINRNLNHG